MTQQEYDKFMEAKMTGWMNLESDIRVTSYYLYCAVLRAERNLATMKDENINLSDSKYTAMIIQGVKNTNEAKEIYTMDLDFIRKNYLQADKETKLDMFHVEHSEQSENLEFISFMDEHNKNWREAYSQDALEEIKKAYEEVTIRQKVKEITEVVYSGLYPQFSIIYQTFVDYQNAFDNLTALLEQNTKNKQ